MFALREFLVLVAIISVSSLIQPEALGSERMTYQIDTFTVQGLPGVDGACGVVAPDDTAYFLGGVGAGASQNGVYKSVDKGRNWTFLHNAPWDGRHSMGCLIAQNKIVVLGGDFKNPGYQTDVWSWSMDEQDPWVEESSNAPWAGRVLFYTFTDGYSLWVGGGQTHSNISGTPTIFFTDLWRSDDLGKSWQEVTDSLPIGVRASIGEKAPFWKGGYWLTGGGNYDTTDFTTRRFTTSTVKITLIGGHVITEMIDPNTRNKITPGLYSSLEEFDGKLWRFFGHDGTIGAPGDFNEMSYTENGKAWTKLTPNPVPARHAATILKFSDRIVGLAGSNYSNDGFEILSESPPPPPPPPPPGGETHYGATANSTTAWSTARTLVDGSITLTPGATVASIGASFSGAHSGFIAKIFKENSTTDYDIVWSGPATDHPGGGFAQIGSPDFVVPSTGTYRIGLYLPAMGAETFSTQSSRATKTGDATGTGQTFAYAGDGTLVMSWTEPE